MALDRLETELVSLFNNMLAGGSLKTTRLERRRVQAILPDPEYVGGGNLGNVAVLIQKEGIIKAQMSCLFQSGGMDDI